MFLKSAISSLALFAAAVLFQGCMSYDYTGTVEDSLPGDAKVRLFTAEDQFQTAGAKTLGVLTFTAPPSWNSADIRNAIRKQARQRGANGAIVVEMKRIPAGSARTDQLRNEQGPGWTVEDNSNTATSFRQQNIQYSSGSDQRKTIYETQIKANLIQLPEPED